jgi:hypothetical protein
MTNSRYWPQEAPPRGLARIEPPLKTANTTNPPAPPNAMEKHFTLEQIAEAWGISVRNARRIFRDQPGVVDLMAHRKSLTSRSYQVLRIPASVAARVHAQRDTGFTLGTSKKQRSYSK